MHAHALQIGKPLSKLAKTHPCLKKVLSTNVICMKLCLIVFLFFPKKKTCFPNHFASSSMIFRTITRKQSNKSKIIRNYLTTFTFKQQYNTPRIASFSLVSICNGNSFSVRLLTCKRNDS